MVHKTDFTREEKKSWNFIVVPSRIEAIDDNFVDIVLGW
jgi:hypothetical protein